MKQRRIVITSFLLCAVLIMGVGFAALTDLLQITGDAMIDVSQAELDLDSKVYFSAAVANTNPTNETGDYKDTANISGTNNDQATCSVKSLRGKDGSATFTFTIKNASDVKVYITPSLSGTSTLNAEYFTLESDWNGATKELAGGAEISYTITVACIKTPTETINSGFMIELNVSTTAPV